MSSETSKISPFWRGQLLLFDKPPAPTYSSRQGYKLLFVFLFSEAVVRPLFDAGAQWLTIARSNWRSLAELSILTVLVCFLVINFARVPLSQLGLYSWFRWSRTEKSYFPQIVLITIVVFSFFVFADLKTLWTRPDLWKISLSIFVSKLIWGFYQEFLYRGVLQTELVRRWGTVLGV